MSKSPVVCTGTALVLIHLGYVWAALSPGSHIFFLIFCPTIPKFQQRYFRCNTLKNISFHSTKHCFAENLRTSQASCVVFRHNLWITDPPVTHTDWKKSTQCFCSNWKTWLCLGLKFLLLSTYNLIYRPKEILSWIFFLFKSHKFFCKVLHKNRKCITLLKGQHKLQTHFSVCYIVCHTAGNLKVFDKMLLFIILLRLKLKTWAKMLISVSITWHFLKVQTQNVRLNLYVLLSP